MANLTFLRFLCLCLICFFCSVGSVFAADERIVTIVHPIRSREQWDDLRAFDQQIRLMQDNSLAATWLVQYSALTDQEIVSRLHTLPVNQEIGVFLEVDEWLANTAQAAYIHGDGDWARADKVLLSGYTPAERKRMIDVLLIRFKQEFGYYPTTVGAWYVDALSQQYLYDQYGVTAVMDCADQYVTDGYGLWGKPWGTPFYPSAYNGFVPAQDNDSFIPVVKIQWAPRDPVRGYGKTVADSTFSVQANDYPRHGLDVSYFDHILQQYLFTVDPLTQLTMGIEVGQEGKGFAKEYADQIAVVKQYVAEGKITALTVREFAAVFRRHYPERTPGFLVSGADMKNRDTSGYWYTTPSYRVGMFLQDGMVQMRDLRWYDDYLLFPDLSRRDPSYPLLRVIPSTYDMVVNGTNRTLFTNIVSVEPQRDGEAVLLQLGQEDGTGHQIRLERETIRIDEETLSRPVISSPWMPLKKGLIQAVFWIQVHLPSVWYGDIRFASINGSAYVGVWSAPNSLFGVRTTWPYVGRFDIPFQVLSRFRTFPRIDLLDRMTMYLVSNQ